MSDTDLLIEKTVANLLQLVEGDTVIGKTIVGPDNTYVIPVSKVSVGIVSGTGEYGENKGKKGFQSAGGGGAGGSVSPLGFLVLGSGSRFIPVSREEENKWANLINSALDIVKPQK